MLPKYPSCVGKRGALVTPDGHRTYYRITDQVAQPQSDNPKKLLCLQRIAFDDDGRIELRLAYYIIGKKTGKMRGRWVWGQYATFLPAKDFAGLVRAARRKGWI